MITQKEIMDILSYNPDNGIFTWIANRKRVSIGDTAGCISDRKGKAYVFIFIKGKSYSAHRLAFLYMNGSFPDSMIDHKNGNGTDNRWSNLRLATLSENNKNSRKRSDNTSGITGVSKHKRSGLWQVRASFNNKNIHIGYYKTIFEAAAARKSAEIKFGYDKCHGQDRPRYLKDEVCEK